MHWGWSQSSDRCLALDFGQDAFDFAEEVVGAEGFWDERDILMFLGEFDGAFGRKSGDENDGDPATTVPEIGCEFESRFAGHDDIEDEQAEVLPRGKAASFGGVRSLPGFIPVL